MSQRNPMNERYTQERTSGTTRKSAASAKPVSKAGASVYVKSNKPAKRSLMDRFKGDSEPAKSSSKSSSKVDASEQRQTARQRRRAVSRFVPETADFKHYNKRRMMYSAGGCGIIVIAILMSIFTPYQIPSIALMIIAWILFCVSIYIDSRYLRPIREREYAKAEAREKKHKKK